jgi:hypothetical protein
METKIIILGIIGGLIFNFGIIQIIKFLCFELYDEMLRTYGPRGLKLRLSLMIILMNLPGLVNGLIGTVDPLMNSICTFSAFFAVIMILRNLPKKEITAPKA